MKRVKIFLSSILMVMLLIPNVVMASNEEDGLSKAKAAAVMSIDNNNVYEKMDKTYQKGYSPTVQNGTVSLVLPLITSEPVWQNQIRVAFDLGDPTLAPFQFQNYDKTVKLKKHLVNDGSDEAESFKVAVDIPLVEKPVNGRYPVVLTATGQWAEGEPFSFQFSLYVTISDGIDPSAEITGNPEPELESESSQDFEPQVEPVSESDASPEPEEKPVSQAKILLEHFSVSPALVTTGEEFSISATFRNTSESQALDNVKIMVTEESADIIPADGDTGSYYFKTIAKKETVTIDMKMKVANNAKAEPHKLKFAIEYEGDKATAYTASEEAVVQITQPVRLEFDEPQIPAEVNAGDTMSVSMNVMNLGLSTVHNVRMSVEAEGFLPEKTAFLGNIESGAAQKGDIYVFVTMLDSGDSEAESNEERYDSTQGKVVLNYEDEYGQEYSEVFAFTTNINPPVIMGEEEFMEDELPKNQRQWWISVILIAVIIMITVGIWFYNKKKQERIRQQEDEEDKDDEIKF